MPRFSYTGCRARAPLPPAGRSRPAVFLLPPRPSDSRLSPLGGGGRMQRGAHLRPSLPCLRIARASRMRRRARGRPPMPGYCVSTTADTRASPVEVGWFVQVIDWPGAGVAVSMPMESSPEVPSLS